MNRFYELIKRLTLTGSQCVYCTREIPEGELVCGECARKAELLKNSEGFYKGGILYAYRYEGPVRSLIHQFKYNDMPRYSIFIAQQMADFLNDYEVNADCLTFVPIHKNRLKERGFDQGEMIATHLGVLLGIVLAVAAVVVMTILNDTMKSEDDVERYLGLSTLASVPDRNEGSSMKKFKKKK